MLATILAFLGTLGGKLTVGSLGLLVLGYFAKSIWYRKVREALGRSAYAAGVAVSALGNSKLKLLWNPLENVLTDFLGFLVEQFFAGLRKDNADKIEAHAERLAESGSETRAAALEEKAADLRGAAVRAVGRAAESRR